KKKGIEVLFLTDEIDEWVVSHLSEFDGKKLKSVAKGELDLDDLGEEESKDDEAEESRGEDKELLAQIESTLGERVKEVRVTNRLTTSPACLVTDEHDMSAHLERILSAAGQKIAGAKPILEINPEHPIVQRMRAAQDDPKFEDWAHILHDQALLSEGGRLEDPATFVRRLNEMFQTLAG
ncbi:MAG: molecular chaperone HtpG, partial [Pseudomonadota bacterium]